MSQKRAKRIRRLMMALGDSGIRAEGESSHAKLIMDNRHGEYQHRCLSPVRQMKKRVSAAYGGLNSFLRAELMKNLSMPLPPGTPDAGNDEMGGVPSSDGSIPSAALLSDQQEPADA